MTVKEYNLDILDNYTKLINGLSNVTYHDIEQMKDLYRSLLNISCSLMNFTNHHETMFSIGGHIGENIDTDEEVLDGFVYLARQTNEKNLYKIGMTKDLSKREKTFKTGNMFVDIIASMKHAKYKDIEKLLHTRLNERRLSGEWFLLDDPLVKEIIEKFGFNIHVE